MSFNSIKSKTQSGRGFTIVELLIVIVVIGILAAITIVAYNGVTARANTTSSKSAANSFAKKAEIYNADGTTNKYPDTAALITSAASTATWSLTGVTATYAGAAVTTAPTGNSANSTIRVAKCGSGTPATQAAVTSTNITGLNVYAWDFSANAEAAAISVGTVTGTGIACPTS